MSSLGDLVVNLKANTTNFVRGMKRSQNSLRDFSRLASTAVIAAGAAAGAGLLKLAADSEVLQVKFKVLLKSGEAAAAMIQDINKFAAETPFSKIDIGKAAQLLLAFQIPANDVIDTLRQVGDVAALIGAPIGEIAELYGKASVQGQLYAEDLNQFMGRGIGILQELAKVTGQPVEAIKKLASEGKITAEHMKLAFRNMTTAGGDFEGGMAQLSQTTSGLLSTVKDNVIQLADSMGKELLPFAKAATQQLLEFTQSVKGYGPILVKAGVAIVALAVTVKVLTTALILLQSVSGPAGWAALAAGAAAAAVALGALDGKMKQVMDSARHAAAAPVKAAQDAAAGATNQASTAFIRGAAGYGKLLKKEVKRLADERKRVEESFLDRIRDVQDSLRIQLGLETEITQEIRKQRELGISEPRLAELKQLLELQKEVEAASDPSRKFAPLIQKGSAEAFKVTVTGGSRESKVVEIARRQEAHLKELVELGKRGGAAETVNLTLQGAV